MRLREDPFLKLGVVAMTLALLITGLVAAYAFLGTGEKSSAAKPAEKAGASGPLVESDPGVEPKKEPTVALPATEREATGEPDQRPDTLPVEEENWPSPTEGQVEAANSVRRYELPPEAVMGLTVPAIDLRNAPVLRSDARDALDRGVVHTTGTSLPWSATPERNVYLAGHKLGFPGTGSHLIFYRLDELSEGDEVILKDRQGERYAYEVVETFAVDPEDSWVTGRIRNRDMVTLQTCVGRDFSKRLIVRADRQ